MLLGTLGASWLGNLLAGKGILRASSGHPLSSSLTNKKGKGIVRAGAGNNKGKGILRAGFGNNKKRMGFLMPPNPLTNFKIQKYYKNEPIFNGVFSRNNLPKKNKGGGLCNKSWWICKCRYTLDCFIL